MQMKGTIDGIVRRSLETISEEDYIDAEDGLIHCHVCHEPKQYRLKKVIMGHEIVGTPCACERKKMEEEKAIQMKAEWFKHLCSLYHAINPMTPADEWIEPKYGRLTFDLDDGSNRKYAAVAKRYAAKYREIRRKNIGILFSGGVGCGKTFLACCIANKLIEKERMCGVFNFPAILRKLSDYKTRDDVMWTLRRYDFLVLDDVGAERGTEYSQEQAFMLVDGLENSGVCVCVTTNLSLESLRNPQDMTQKRIYSKLLGLCPIQVEMNGPDKREEIAKRLKEEAREILTGITEGDEE